MIDSFSKAKLGFASVALSASAILAIDASLCAQTKLTVRASTAWVSPERVAKNVTIEIAGGKIRSVAGGDEVKDGRSENMRSYAGAVLTAGFIDVHRPPIAADSIGERAESFTPELNAARAYDAWSEHWKRIRARGVTSAVVTPRDENVGSGQAAFVKTARPARIAGSTSYVKFSLTKQAISMQRKPTSLLGALELLRDGYASLEQKGTRMSAAQRTLATTIGGARPVAIAARARREILAALEHMRAWQLQAFLVYADDAERCLDEIAADKTAVVLPALTIDATRKQRKLVAMLAERQVPIAFCGESSDERAMPALQTSLAIAVRAGLTPAQALATVTTTPATLAGRSEEVGTLVNGRDADLVVWSGQPFDLRSRVLLVVQNGRIVFEAKAKPSSTKSSNEEESAR